MIQEQSNHSWLSYRSNLQLVKDIFQLLIASIIHICGHYSYSIRTQYCNLKHKYDLEEEKIYFKIFA